MLGVKIIGDIFAVVDLMVRRGEDAIPLKVDDASVIEGVLGEDPCELSEGSLVNPGIGFGGYRKLLRD